MKRRLKCQNASHINEIKTVQDQDRKIAAINLHTSTVTATRSPRRRLQASCEASLFTDERCDATPFITHARGNDNAHLVVM